MASLLHDSADGTHSLLRVPAHDAIGAVIEHDVVGPKVDRGSAQLAEVLARCGEGLSMLVADLVGKDEVVAEGDGRLCSTLVLLDVYQCDRMDDTYRTRQTGVANDVVAAVELL